MNGRPALVGIGGRGANQLTSAARSGTASVVDVDGNEVGGIELDGVGDRTIVVGTVTGTVAPAVVVACSALLQAARRTTMVATPKR